MATRERREGGQEGGGVVIPHGPWTTPGGEQPAAAAEAAPPWPRTVRGSMIVNLQEAEPTYLKVVKSRPSAQQA